MGWTSEDGQHEGYVCALIEDGQLGFFVDVDGRSARMREPVRELDEHRSSFRPVYVRVACSCGWRSRALRTPLDTEWAPFITSLPENADDAAAALWTRHLADDTPYNALSEAHIVRKR